MLELITEVVFQEAQHPLVGVAVVLRRLVVVLQGEQYHHPRPPVPGLVDALAILERSHEAVFPLVVQRPVDPLHGLRLEVFII